MAYRKKGRRSGRVEPARASHSVSRCVALVVADGSIRRKKERTLYRRRITELERETERVKVFEERDVPAFDRWIDTEFGSVLKEYREAVAAIHDFQELEDQVRGFAQMRRVTLPQAFKEVSAAREAGTVAALFRTDSDGHRSAGVDEGFAGLDDEEELFREFRNMASEFFGFDVEDDEADYDGDFHRRDHGGASDQRRASSSRANAAERDSDIYLKGLYRQLVRVLHPDAGAEMTPERQRQWAEVQDAYSWGDVHRLARLHAEICNGRVVAGPVLDLDSMPIGDIISIRQPVEQRLRHLREKLRCARREPSWGFAGLLKIGGQKLAYLRAQINEDLEADLADALGEKERLERLVEKWKRGPKPKATPRKKPGPKAGSSRRGRGASFKEGWAFD